MSCDHPITAVSLFDGVGGFPYALSQHGIRTVATCEIDRQAAGVTAQHFPEAVHFIDVTKVTAHDLLAAGFCPRCGIITAGWPCQDLSLAGRRLGLGGSRSGLFFEITRIIDEFLLVGEGVRPRWLVLENVPGLLSSVCPCPGGGACGGADGKRGYYGRERVRYECGDSPHPVRGGACGPGRCMELHGGAMGAVVGALGECGYGFAYRVLDAQHFGVPQRRRRVVFVAHLGDGAAPAEILFEPEGGAGDSAAGSETGTDAAGGVGTGPAIPGVAAVAPTLQGGGQRGYRIDAETAAGGGLVPAFSIQGTAVSAGDDIHSGPTGPGWTGPEEPMFTLDTRSPHAVAVPADDGLIAGTLTRNMAGGGGGVDENSAADGHLVVNALTTTGITGTDDNTAQGGHLVALPLTAREGKGPDSDATSGNLIGFDLSQITSKVNRSNPQPGDPQPTIGATGQPHVAFTLRADAGMPQAWNTTLPLVESVTGEQAHTLTSEGADASEDGTGRGTPIVFQGQGTNVGPMGTLRSGNGNVTGGVPFTTHTLTAGDGSVTEDGRGRGNPVIPDLSAVRRLTPVECERLQGFPDGWTAHACQVQADGNRWQVVQRDLPQSDAPRYRQMGNSIATVVFSWVAGRLVKHA